MFYFNYASFFITVCRVGYTLTLGLLSICAIHVIHPYIIPVIPVPIIPIIIEIIMVTLLIIVISELIAQTIFRVEPNTTLKLFAVPAFFFFVLLFPLGWLYLRGIKFFTTLFAPGKTPLNLASFGESISNPWLNRNDASQDRDDDGIQEFKIFQKALGFSKVRIRDCMIPRTEIEAINITANINELRKRFSSSGYSKIIVYRNSIDNIVGYVNSKELFKHPATIKEKLNPVAFVPESMQASKLLKDFMQFHRSVAVVVDEYGGTSGLVTLEDIMEEIFGEINDEHDTDDLVERQVNPHEFVLSGRLEIEYLNSKFNLKIPENEEYDTLAGFILFHFQNLPKPNAIVKIGNYTIKILRVSQTRIELVQLTVTEG